MRRDLLIIFGFILTMGCQKDDVEAVHHRDIDSTIYTIYNVCGKRIEIGVWNHSYAFTLKQSVDNNDYISFGCLEVGSYPSLLPTADSCLFAFDDGKNYAFYPLHDKRWYDHIIAPITRNDSILTHYPFKQSNCKITIRDTNLGKQRIYCEYYITENDYNYAKHNAR